MKDTKTTPGEWHVDGWDLTSVISKIDDYHYKHVCTCNYGYLNPSEYFELNKANAKLISAAPEMLEALTKLVEHFTPLANTPFEGKLLTECNRAINKATTTP